MRPYSVRLRPVLWRSVAGIGCIVAAGALLGSAETMLHLRQLGDFIDANSTSGLTAAGFGAFLGKVQFVLLAAGLAALVSFPRSLRKLAPSLGRTAASPLVLLLLALAAVAVAVTIERKFEYGGRTYFVLVDDAMITMRYARNLAEGVGLVYNAGERVEGFTSPLWALYLAFVHAAGAPPHLAPLAVMITSWALLGVTLAAFTGLLRAFRFGAPWVALAGAALLFDLNTVEWTYSGLETTALGAAAACATWALATGRTRTFALSIAICAVVRSDGATLAVPLGLLHVLHATDRRRAMGRVALAALPAVAYEVFRLGYYGVPLPNTYYLKKLPIADAVVTGIGGFGFRVLFQYAAPLVLAGATAASARAPLLLRELQGVALFQLAYGAWVGGDSFHNARFFTPVLPLVLAGACWALRQALSRAPPPMRWSAAAALAFTLPIQASRGMLGHIHQMPSYPADCYSAASLIQQNVPRSATVTIDPAGTTAYYAITHRFIDVLGKNDAHIARAPAHGVSLGHNRFDFDYVYDVRRADVAFLHIGCARAGDLAHKTQDEVARIARDFPRWVSSSNLHQRAHPTFLSRYLPNRVHVVGRLEHPPLGCLFVRDDSGISAFWSSSGTPPRLAGFTMDFDEEGGDARVVLDGTWGPREILDDGAFARRTGNPGPSRIDGWLDVSRPMLLEVCLGGTRRTVPGVNGVAVPLSWSGGCGRAAVGPEVLRRRTASTQITFPDGGLAVTRVSLASP